MSEVTRVLDDLVPALEAGQYKDVMAALGDAVVEVAVDGQPPITLIGDQPLP